MSGAVRHQDEDVTALWDGWASGGQRNWSSEWAQSCVTWPGAWVTTTVTPTDDMADTVRVREREWTGRQTDSNYDYVRCPSLCGQWRLVKGKNLRKGDKQTMVLTLDQQHVGVTLLSFNNEINFLMSNTTVRQDIVFPHNFYTIVSFSFVVAVCYVGLMIDEGNKNILTSHVREPCSFFYTQQIGSCFGSTFMSMFV